MNDRFKFRAWDKARGKMYSSEDNVFEYRSEYGELKFELEIEEGQYDIENEDLIVMQCTGLKDKTGKLIYEGDIVRGPNLVNKGNLKNRVVETLTWTGIQPFCDSSFSHYSGVEIIGNIYENPELLNKN